MSSPVNVSKFFEAVLNPSTPYNKNLVEKMGDILIYPVSRAAAAIAPRSASFTTLYPVAIAVALIWTASALEDPFWNLNYLTLVCFKKGLPECLQQKAPSKLFPKFFTCIHLVFSTAVAGFSLQMLGRLLNTQLMKSSI